MFIDNIEFINTGNSTRPQFDDWVRFYPNPVSKYINVSFNLSQKQDVTVQLVDILGQVYRQSKYIQLLNETIQLDVQELSGLFFLIVKESDAHFIEKVIIRN